MKKENTLTQSIGHKIALLRKQKGMTQTELGKKLGLSQRGIAYYEKEASTLNLLILEKISSALGVDLIYFFNGTEQELTISKNDLDEIKQDKKLKKFYSLSKANQKMVLKFINSLSKK